MKQYLIIFLSLSLSVVMRAQKYHDAVLEDVQGPVKEIVYVNANIESVFYDCEGRESRRNEQKEQRQYDNVGYLINYDVTIDGTTWDTHVEYDHQHRVKRSVMLTNGGRAVNDLSYNKNGQIEKSVITISTKDISMTYTSTFICFTFDGYGNWLSRVRKRNQTAIYESRIIGYW